MATEIVRSPQVSRQETREAVGNETRITQWHSLSREEQAKYYEKARQERQLHMQLYPGWSARDNYGYGSKKKKRKKDRSPAELGGIGPLTRGWSHGRFCTLASPPSTPSPH